MTKGKIISKVLEIKEFNTEQLEAEVKNAREKLFSEEKKLENFENVHKSTCMQFTERQMNGSLPVREMELYYSYLRHLAKEIELQKKIVSIRREEVDARQHALLEAYKEERLMGKLHGKIVDHETRQAAKVEQKEMDYAFILRKAEQ